MRGDVVPHLGLDGPGLPAGRNLLAGLAVLLAAQLRVGVLRRRGEVLGVAGAVPAPRLHATDRHAQLGLRGDQHRHVEGAVLLGAEHLLSLVQEDRCLAAVVHDDVADGRSAVVLPDAHPMLAGLRQRQVLLARVGPEQGKDGERAGHVWVLDADRLAQVISDGGVGSHAC